MTHLAPTLPTLPGHTLFKLEPAGAIMVPSFAEQLAARKRRIAQAHDNRAKRNAEIAAATHGRYYALVVAHAPTPFQPNMTIATFHYASLETAQAFVEELKGDPSCIAIALEDPDEKVLLEWDRYAKGGV